MSMMLLTIYECVIAAICVLLLGFILGLLLCRLLLRLYSEAGMQQPVSRQPLSYRGDIRQTVAVLQQLQVMIGRKSAESNPNLADLATLLCTMQQHFGHVASLERVIQVLVAQDLEQQLENRRRGHQSLTTTAPCYVESRQKVVIA